ncbi:MAG: hypothetical protein WCY19_01080 [Candidatus Gastranaerophilaceae bacterium]
MINFKKIFSVIEEDGRTIIIILGIKIAFGQNTNKFWVKIRAPFFKAKKMKEFKRLLRQYGLQNQAFKKGENKKIYVIGDSHVNFFSGEEYIHFFKYKKGINKTLALINCFEPYHLGAALAYNILNPNASSKGLEKIEWLLAQKIPPNSILLLCFGEIDMRCHVVKQSKIQDKSIDEVVDDVLQCYIQFVKYLQKKGYKIITWAPIASQKDTISKHSEFSKIGTESERNYATKIFSEKLNLFAAENKFINCSIYNKLVDENNLTIEEYIADKCHLSQKALPFMVEVLTEKNIIGVNKGEIVINYPL